MTISIHVFVAFELCIIIPRIQYNRIDRPQTLFNILFKSSIQPNNIQNVYLNFQVRSKKQYNKTKQHCLNDNVSRRI